MLFRYSANSSLLFCSSPPRRSSDLNIVDHLQPQRVQSRLSHTHRCTHHPKARLWAKFQRDGISRCREKITIAFHRNAVNAQLTQQSRSPKATTRPVPTITHTSLHSPPPGPSMGQISARCYFAIPRTAHFCFALPLHDALPISTLSITYSHNASSPDYHTHIAALTTPRPVYGPNFSEMVFRVAEKRSL